MVLVLLGNELLLLWLELLLLELLLLLWLEVLGLLRRMAELLGVARARARVGCWSGHCLWCPSQAEGQVIHAAPHPPESACAGPGHALVPARPREYAALRVAVLRVTEAPLHPGVQGHLVAGPLLLFDVVLLDDHEDESAQPDEGGEPGAGQARLDQAVGEDRLDLRVVGEQVLLVPEGLVMSGSA